MIRDMVRDFAEKEIKPYAREVDETSTMRIESFKKMAELGLGIPFPEEYGGSGGDTVSYALAVEEIGRACGGTGLSYAFAVSLGASPIYNFGTEEQKQEWLVPLAKGETLGSFGLTEPNAGSDAGAHVLQLLLMVMTTLLMEKCWITNAGYARQIIVTAVTGKREDGKRLFLLLLCQQTHRRNNQL